MGYVCDLWFDHFWPSVLTTSPFTNRVGLNETEYAVTVQVLFFNSKTMLSYQHCFGQRSKAQWHYTTEIMCYLLLRLNFLEAHVRFPHPFYPPSNWDSRAKPSWWGFAFLKGRWICIVCFQQFFTFTTGTSPPSTICKGYVWSVSRLCSVNQWRLLCWSYMLLLECLGTCCYLYSF